MATQLPQDNAPSENLQSQDREKQSLLTLLHRLTHELTILFRHELALAGAELTHTLTTAVSGVVAAGVGGLVSFAGFLVLLAAAVLGLSEVMAAWLAALIVGILTSAAGIAALLAGIHKLPPTLRPKRTVRSLSKDKDTLTRRVP